MSNPTEKEKGIRLWTPAGNVFLFLKLYIQVNTQYSVFLTRVLKTPRITLHVWRGNSLRWSRSGVINARRSARGSLWASRGVWARLTLPSLLPPPPRRYVCPSPRQMPTGRGLSSLLGARPGTSNGVQSTSVLFSSCTLWERRMKAMLVYTCAAALMPLQIATFFADEMYS